MANVVTFTDFRPIARFDGIAFDRARVQEATSSSGPWTDVEEFLLDPIDADPANPAARSFTTDEATILDGWFRILWLDPIDNTSASEAIHSSGESGMPPSKSDLRLRSELLRTIYPTSPYDAQKEQDLESARVLAISIVESLTCRTLDESLSASDQTLALAAVVGKAEQVALASTAKASRSRLGFRKLKSISAGPWSETYFGPEEAAKAQMLDADPMLHQVLWALATEECRQKWLELWKGEYAPHAISQEVAWGFRGRRY